MFKTPVLLIVFNRPDTTKKVFEAIRSMQPSILYVAGDGAREGNDSDMVNIKKVEEIIAAIDWECALHKKFSAHNAGCSEGPKNAIEWFFSQNEQGIILEDDCLPSPDFFHYCEALLEHYKDNPRIINICGSNMGYNRGGGSGYFFSRFMNMSGWATWRRSVKSIDYGLTAWKEGKRTAFDVYKMMRQSVFDTDIAWFKYWKDKFNRTITENNITWWDWQWIYNQLSKKQLSIIPNRNLVTNIGFNSAATHTKDENNPLANVPLQSVEFPLQHPVALKPDLEYEEKAVKWIWCYHKRKSSAFYFKKMLSKILKLN